MASGFREGGRLSLGRLGPAASLPCRPGHRRVPAWESVESVDGAEGILGKLLEAVQETNGLAAGLSKEAQGN